MPRLTKLSTDQTDQIRSMLLGLAAHDAGQASRILRAVGLQTGADGSYVPPKWFADRVLAYALEIGIRDDAEVLGSPALWESQVPYVHAGMGSISKPTQADGGATLSTTPGNPTLKLPNFGTVADPDRRSLKPTFQRCWTIASKEILMDAVRRVNEGNGVDVVEWLAEAAGYAIAFQEWDMAINGQGSGGAWCGVIRTAQYGTTTLDEHTIDAVAVDSVSIEDIGAMLTALGGAHLPFAKWTMSPGAMATLVANEGPAVFQTVIGPNGRPMQTLAGLPVRLSTRMAAPQESEWSVLLTNWKRYQIAEAAPFTMQHMTELLAGTGQDAILFYTRTDGVLVDPSAGVTLRHTAP